MLLQSQQQTYRFNPVQQQPRITVISIPNSSQSVNLSHPQTLTRARHQQQQVQPFILPNGSLVIPISSQNTGNSSTIQPIQITPIPQRTITLSISPTPVQPQPTAVINLPELPAVEDTAMEEVGDMNTRMEIAREPPATSNRRTKRRKSIFYGMSSRNKRRILDVSANVTSFLSQLESSRVKGEERKKRRGRSFVSGDKGLKSGKDFVEARMKREEFKNSSGVGKYRNLIARIAKKR